MSYWIPDPRGSTGRSQSSYWADADPEFVRRQQELGRDTSELKPEIRLEYEARLHAAKAQARTPIREQIRTGLRRSDGGDLFGRFETQRFPWYRRLFLWLRGWDV